MNILIEDAETLEYLASNGKWTKNAASGKSFAATEAAVDVAKNEAIHNFNIVCYIPLTKQIVNLDHGQGRVAETNPA